MTLTTATTAAPALPPYLQELVDEATGKRHRADAALPRTGGPAGNAKLTAWTGLLLLVLFLAELLTLVNVGGLISWHIALGAALIPPALLKTATTGWRMVRYYTGSRHYKVAGPPPLLLRLLGPLVVLSTLALLGTGSLLGLLGTTRSFTPLVTVLGFAISPLTLHQASFAVWAGATGLHVLARLVPALRVARPSGPGSAPAPGRALRTAALVGVTTLAAVASSVLLSVASSWHVAGALAAGG